MRDPFQSDQKRKKRVRLIEVDAWVDSGLFALGRVIVNRASTISQFMRQRMRARGIWRIFSELLGDGLTLGAGGAVLMLALALPAHEATQSDWRSKGDLAVTFLDRYGSEIGFRGIRLDNSVSLDDMPDHLLKAVLATEDRRFFEHFGIDVFGTARAMVENLRANDVVQGGSSLTQQLAKNLFLTNERTIQRKIKEAFLALWLESNLTKREILKEYLDRAYMGGGNFGVQAASEFYFNKPVQEVTLSEAAMLAGLFKAPTRFAPHVNLPAARARANEVLTNMVEAGFVTEGQVIGARRQPADVIQGGSGDATPDYFLDWAFAELRKRRWPERVLTVRTTIDLGLQRAADEAVENSLRQFGDTFRVKQAAMVAMEPDGAVRAMVGGRDYGESQFNRATTATRQPGSSFKPYVYATAMMGDYTPDSVVRDMKVCISTWCPRNYSGGFSGAVSLTTALVKSINTIPVRLGKVLTREAIIDTAQRMGVATPLRNDWSVTLGSSEVTVLDQTVGYSVFANGGYKVTPFAYSQVLSSQGEVLYDRRTEEPEPERVLSERAVKAMNGMLVQVPEWGTGRRAKLDGIRTAGKTGTTTAYRDAWFVGYTGNYTAAVWFGNDNYTSTRRLTGGRLPAETWHQFMEFAHQGVALKPIPLIDEPFEEGGRQLAEADDESQDDTGLGARETTLSADTTQQLIAIQSLLQARSTTLRRGTAGRPVAPDELGSLGHDQAPVAGAGPASWSDIALR